MNEELVKEVDPKEFGLEKEKVQSIADAFTPKIIERDALKIQYEQLINEDLTETLCSDAKTLRNKLVKVRTGIADIHKTQKSFYLAAGKFVDAWKNKETLPVTQMESKLSEIETHFQKLEKERTDKLKQSRLDELAQYNETGEFIDLVNMPDEEFEKYLGTVKHSYEAKIQAEKEAEEKKQAELKRIAEEKIANEKAEKIERERIEKENAKLKKEAQEREEKAEKERLEREKEAKIEADKRAKVEADRKAIEEKERKKQEVILQAERKEKERMAMELKAKNEAEEKAMEERKAQIQADLNKGDTAKVKDLIADLQALTSKYEFKAKKNQQMYAGVVNLIHKTVEYIKNK